MSSHKMTFGKYEGEELDSIPTTYLEWLCEKMESEGDTSSEDFRAIYEFLYGEEYDG